MICALGLNAYAQKEIRWSISIGGAFPIGDFASLNYNNNPLVSDCVLFDEGEKGGAAGGLNLGYDVIIPLKSEKLDFTIAFDFHFNGLNDNASLYLDEIGQYLVDNSVQLLINAGASQARSECSKNSTPRYLNMPLLAGVRYTIPFSSSISFYADGGVGYNFRNISPLRLTLRNDYVYNGIMYNETMKMTNTYSTSGSIAFRLGAGLIVKNNISFSAYYYYLGSANVSMQSRVEGDGGTQTQTYQNGTIYPMEFVLKLGYTF